MVELKTTIVQKIKEPLLIEMGSDTVCISQGAVRIFVERDSLSLLLKAVAFMEENTKRVKK